MYKEERPEGATAKAEAFSEGNSFRSREVLCQQRRRGWEALEENVVPFAEIKKYLDYVKEVEGESGLVGLKSFAIEELRKKLSGKEVAYAFSDLEALLREEVAQLLEEDASAYRTLKGTPFYVLLRSGEEPVHSSQLRRYAQSAKRLLEGENLEEFQRDLFQLREKVESLEQKLEVLKETVSEFSTALQGLREVEMLKEMVGGLSERVTEGERRLELLEGELQELRATTSASEGNLDEVYSLQENLSKLRELFVNLEERLYELERRSVGASFEEFSALKRELEALAEELRELKRDQFKVERGEEEQSVGEALAEPEPVGQKRRSLLSGNALYVAIAGLAGLIFLLALLVR